MSTPALEDLTFDIATAPNRDSKYWRQESISWEGILAWMETPAKTKACGNYVLGALKGNRRTKGTILSRSALTLDVDHPDEGFDQLVRDTLPYAVLVHTTYSSTPGKPRYRMIIPTDRSLAPDEYYAAAESVMAQLGAHNFDPGSVQAERYMFKPAATNPADFRHFVTPGPVAEAEDLLSSFERDLSEMPAPKPHKNKRDPFSIEGPIGAFNRAYEDFQDLIDTYELPYESVAADRWQVAGASAAAGMGPVAPGLVFSHHANDPAYNQTCSAFDLARLHLHSHLDEDAAPRTPVNRLPSNLAMLETATKDVRVIRELVGPDFADEMEATADAITSGHTTDWRLGFRLDPRTGAPKDDIVNWDLIADNDPVFKSLFFNELNMAIEVTGDLPWRKLKPGQETFGAGDRSSLAMYIERTYRIRPGRGYLDDIINDRALPNRVNPVRDYLESLEWDGVPRVELCLPGVRETPFTRLAARKAMVAAAARMLQPGIKWDHMLVLHGPEGLGKSYWVDKMARGYSASLGRLGDKDTLITMQRSWIMTSDEGHSLRQSDFNAQKEFITRTADVFRMPYDREAQAHKRHCVIWGTTNDDVFLRKQEGNRRFHIVRCEDAVDFSLLTDEYIDQVWAEAVHLFRNGETLFLEGSQSELAAEAREYFTEEDALTGLISEYLETPVPSDWEEMTPEARSLWQVNRADGFVTGDSKLQRVCSVQVWVEALGRRNGDHKRLDLLEITTALKSIPGWQLLPGRHRVPGYGPQMVFERVEDLI